MLLARQKIFRLVGVVNRRFYCLYSDSQHDEQTFVSFYKKLFGVGQKSAAQILQKHPSLCSDLIVPADVQGSFEFLKSQAFEGDEILKSPTVLLLSRHTCANRIEVLKECGFNEIKVSTVHRFVSLMNKNVDFLKTYRLIDQDRNVAESLVDILDVHVKLSKNINDTMSLKLTRKTIIEQYLINKLGMKHQEVMALWKTYPNIANRSIQSIVNALQVLENEVGFTKEKIIRNGFLIQSNSDNMKRILKEIPSIADVPIKEILHKTPSLASVQVDQIKETMQTIESFQIPEDRILKCAAVLTFKPETVYQRLLDIKNSKELNVLINDSGILRLIYRHNKAKSRMEFLSEMKLKCMSLNVLSGSTEVFDRYVKGGRDRTNGHETLNFLSYKLKLSEESLWSALNKHPHWRFVPVSSLKAVVDYLSQKGYTSKDLANNIHLLLYPLNRVDQKLTALINWRSEQASRPNNIFSKASNSQLLSLCLYFIESEFHFSGNGVWDSDRHDVKQDMSTASIPDFPDSLSKSQKFA